MKLKILSIALVLFCSIYLFPQKVGDAYALDINNIYMPINRKGVLANVYIYPNNPGGQFGGHTFLFSGGFFLSGYSNGVLWANAVASASLVEDYLQGENGDPNNPSAQLYRVGANDPPFGPSWLDWIDAVYLGADFYDGDGNAMYEPVDKVGPNGEPLNSQWDTWEDRPDILGEVTLWCVYHDGAAGSRWVGEVPKGIEVRQTAFAYSSVSYLQNVVFIRYRIKYVGLSPYDPNELTDVYFGTWDDPDLGYGGDDLAGCDTLLSGGFTYNDGPDNEYGNNPPSFFVKTLAGPVTYIPGVTFIDNNANGTYDEGIDTPLDTAYVHRGQDLGINEYPGAKNLGLYSSVNYLNGDPTISDPNTGQEARYYMLGLTKQGTLIDPCTWTKGQVRGGVDCSKVNPLFWYSGDPVENYGWINNFPADQRQMQNVGPFSLEKGKEYEIFVAYTVGQSTDALSSVTESKRISEFTERLYAANFNTTLVSVKEILTSYIPEDYFLSQNYPNPFNPSTAIEFSIPDEGYVSLIVYDVLGDEVKTLVNQELKVGSYKTKINAANLSSGIYFYTLKTKNYIQTKKMILIK
jgi:hypothetical protein